MATAAEGSTVKVHYTGKLEDGEVFDSSLEREPLEFQIGSKTIIPAFEKAVVGMEQGETKSVTLSPVEGYGERDEDQVVEVPRENFPDDVEPEVGKQLQVRSDERPWQIVTITDVSDDTVELDANHPLAGHTLTFDIQLVEVA